MKFFNVDTDINLNTQTDKAYSLLAEKNLVWLEPKPSDQVN